jgi:hypothetical protein
MFESLHSSLLELFQLSLMLRIQDTALSILRRRAERERRKGMMMRDRNSTEASHRNAPSVDWLDSLPATAALDEA